MYKYTYGNKLKLDEQREKVFKSIDSFAVLDEEFNTSLKIFFEGFLYNHKDAPPKKAMSMRILSNRGANLNRLVRNILESLPNEFKNKHVKTINMSDPNDGQNSKTAAIAFIDKLKKENEFNPALIILENFEGPASGPLSILFKDLIFTNPIKGVYNPTGVAFLFLGGQMDPCTDAVDKYDIEINKWQKSTISRIQLSKSLCGEVLFEDKKGDEN